MPEPHNCGHSQITKINASKIEVIWGEGYEMTPITFSDDSNLAESIWTRFQFWARCRAGCHKPFKGYLKTDFRVTWADGETYEGRYDLHENGLGDDNQTLAQHIISFLSFYAGLRCPVHMKQEEYEEFLKGRKVQEFRDFLEKYQIG